MKVERNGFWMVWREHGQSPTRRHPSKQSAYGEAERLAEANPGDVFFVLKATAGVCAQVRPALPIRLQAPSPDPDDYIPF